MEGRQIPDSNETEKKPSVLAKAKHRLNTRLKKIKLIKKLKGLAQSWDCGDIIAAIKANPQHIDQLTTAYEMLEQNQKLGVYVLEFVFAHPDRAIEEVQNYLILAGKNETIVDPKKNNIHYSTNIKIRELLRDFGIDTKENIQFLSQVSEDNKGHLIVFGEINLWNKNYCRPVAVRLLQFVVNNAAMANEFHVPIAMCRSYLLSSEYNCYNAEFLNLMEQNPINTSSICYGLYAIQHMFGENKIFNAEKNAFLVALLDVLRGNPQAGRALYMLDRSQYKDSWTKINDMLRKNLATRLEILPGVLEHTMRRHPKYAERDYKISEAEFEKILKDYKQVPIVSMFMLNRRGNTLFSALPNPLLHLVAEKLDETHRKKQGPSS